MHELGTSAVSTREYRQCPSQTMKSTSDSELLKKLYVWGQLGNSPRFAWNQLCCVLFDTDGTWQQSLVWLSGLPLHDALVAVYGISSSACARDIGELDCSLSSGVLGSSAAELESTFCGWHRRHCSYQQLRTEGSSGIPIEQVLYSTLISSAVSPHVSH